MSYDLSIMQDRRTVASFRAANPVPSLGQLCIETDSWTYTTGDGVSAYLTIRGNTKMDGSERRSADDVYAMMSYVQNTEDLETFSLVSGSVTADYIESGTYNDLPAFVKVGGNPGTDYVRYQLAGIWAVNDASVPAGWCYYTDSDGGSRPWSASTWVADSGDEPVPVITHT